MQTNSNVKLLLEKCSQRLRILVDGIGNTCISILMLREDGFSSDDVLDAEYEVIDDA